MKTLRLILLASLVLASGCGTSPREEALTYHAAISDATGLVENADLEFMRSLLPVVRGEKGDPAAVRAAYDGVKQAIAQAKEKVANASAPDTTSARALTEAHRRFIERHEKWLASDFDAALKAAEDQKLEVAPRAGRVRDLFVRLQDAEYDDFQALRTAQAAFAKEHSLVVREDSGNAALNYLTGLGVANGRLELGGRELGAEVRPAFDEKKVDGARVAKVLQKARDTLAQVEKIVGALKVPTGKAAKELDAAEKDFLKRQGEVFSQYFPELVKLAADPVLSPETRKERLDEVFKLMQAAEQAPLMRLQAARDEFLRENRLITPGR